jgi:hypothetical protein
MTFGRMTIILALLLSAAHEVRAWDPFGIKDAKDTADLANSYKDGSKFKTANQEAAALAAEANLNTMRSLVRSQPDSGQAAFSFANSLHGLLHDNGGSPGVIEKKAALLKEANGYLDLSVSHDKSGANMAAAYAGKGLVYWDYGNVNGAGKYFAASLKASPQTPGLPGFLDLLVQQKLNIQIPAWCKFLASSQSSSHAVQEICNLCKAKGDDLSWVKTLKGAQFKSVQQSMNSTQAVGGNLLVKFVNNSPRRVTLYLDTQPGEDPSRTLDINAGETYPRWVNAGDTVWILDNSGHGVTSTRLGHPVEGIDSSGRDFGFQ